jgi:hypothetical protein
MFKGPVGTERTIEPIKETIFFPRTPSQNHDQNKNEEAYQVPSE